MPAGTAAPVTAAVPVAPEIVLEVPVATSVHAVAAAVPPLSLTTCLTRVRRGNASTPTVAVEVLFAALLSTTGEPGGRATVAVFWTEVCAWAGTRAARVTSIKPDVVTMWRRRAALKM